MPICTFKLLVVAAVVLPVPTEILSQRDSNVNNGGQNLQSPAEANIRLQQSELAQSSGYLPKLHSFLYKTPTLSMSI